MYTVIEILCIPYVSMSLYFDMFVIDGTQWPTFSVFQSHSHMPHLIKW